MTHEQAVETLAAERYLLDEMSEAERDSFEEHFFACEECGEAMRLGSHLRTDATAIFTPAQGTARILPGPADRNRRARWRPAPSVMIPWAAAAVLALTVAYQSRVAVPGDGAFAPVAIRPASRGAVPAIALPASGSVALALDVNTGAEGNPLRYRLTSENGTEVMSGTTKVPSPGVPLVVVIPASRLEAGAAYTVTLTVGEGGAPASEYRFSTAPR
jgi:hypothetical protein